MFCNVLFVVSAQTKSDFKIHTVAFYNLENLFDTINDPNKYDEASPIMEMKFNRGKVYKNKITNMAKVLSEIGTSKVNNSPIIIGVAEIENKSVLEDLVFSPHLRDKKYGIIHFDSPDKRGIDVALLYQKEWFSPMKSVSKELRLFSENGNRIYTRDQLVVSGLLDGEEMVFIVNHWPSRRGGEAKSKSKRNAAARLNRSIIDSIQSKKPFAKIITMGDFNDNPTNESVKDILKSFKNLQGIKIREMYNPMYNMYKEGYGTNAHRDTWSLFDQIILSKSFLDKEDYKSYRFYKAGIFSEEYLINSEGRYKGYPFRSFNRGTYTGGYSDHFPVYVFLIKSFKQAN